jgi:hypothetical protein
MVQVTAPAECARVAYVMLVSTSYGFTFTWAASTRHQRSTL